MTANWGALENLLEARARPNHLPGPEWFKDLEAIEADCEKKGIPYVAGRRYAYNVSSNYTEVRW